MGTTSKRLIGRTALVTGGGQGIGRGCALRLAEEGAIVAVIDLDGDAAKAVGSEIEKHGTKAFAKGGDCCNADVAASFVAGRRACNRADRHPHQ
ncbi:MAG: SDR family NAD(P)-dependent oxidoreductase [Rhizomicrobium sp.]